MGTSEHHPSIHWTDTNWAPSVCLALLQALRIWQETKQSPWHHEAYILVRRKERNRLGRERVSDSDKQVGKRRGWCLESGEQGLVTSSKFPEKGSLERWHWKPKSLSREEHSRHSSPQTQKPWGGTARGHLWPELMREGEVGSDEQWGSTDLCKHLNFASSEMGSEMLEWGMTLFD